MKIKETELNIVHGKLSSVKADAYVLPFLPYHEYPTGVRLEVASAGALGVRDFIDHRLRERKLRYGDVFFVDARGGNANTLIALICRHPQQDGDEIASAIKKGFLGIFLKASKHGVKRIAVPTLCCGEGIDEIVFTKILTAALDTDIEHGIEEVSIVSEDQGVVTKLYHIIE